MGNQVFFFYSNSNSQLYSSILFFILFRKRSTIWLLCLVIFHLVLNLRIEGGSPDGEIAHIALERNTSPEVSSQILAISLPGPSCQDLFPLGVIGQFLPADIVLSYISSAMIQDQLSILINVQLGFYIVWTILKGCHHLPPSKSLACSRFVESGQKVFRIRKTHFIRCSKNLIGCIFVRLPRFFPKIEFCPGSLVNFS